MTDCEARPARAIVAPACGAPSGTGVRALAAATRLAGRRRVLVVEPPGTSRRSRTPWPPGFRGCACEILRHVIDLLRHDEQGTVLVVPSGDDAADVAELARLVMAARTEPDMVHLPAGADDGAVVPFAGSVTSLLLMYHHAAPGLLRSALLDVAARARRRPVWCCVHRDVLPRALGLLQPLAPRSWIHA